jgi:sporulation protein YlmC with PRC-barrel domain
MTRFIGLMLQCAMTAPFLLALPAAAAEPGAPQAVKDEASWLDMRASELIGKEVASPDGKALGEIEDMIVDVRRGAVQHVILSFGGVADVGDKLFVFPVNAFRRDENRERIIVNVQPEQLKGSRGFTRENWPAACAREQAARRGRWLAPDGRKGGEDKRALPLSAFSVSERGEEVKLKK